MPDLAHPRDDERLTTVAIARLSTVARRAVRILRASLALAVACGAIAYVLGWIAEDDPWPGYALVALPFAAAPAVLAAIALGRVRAIVHGAPTLLADLRAMARDPETRRRLTALVDGSAPGADRARAGGATSGGATSGDAASGDAGRIGWRRVRGLWHLRREVVGPSTRSLGLWTSVMALARLPWILLATVLGCGLLMAWSLISLVAIAVC